MIGAPGERAGLGAGPERLTSAPSDARTLSAATAITRALDARRAGANMRLLPEKTLACGYLNALWVFRRARIGFRGVSRTVPWDGVPEGPASPRTLYEG